MNNSYDNRENVGLNATEFLGSYLGKEDIDGESIVTIVDVTAEEMPGSTRRKLVIQFAEHEKRLILNSTNIKILSKLFRSTNTAHWRGPVTLYVDEDVEYAGRTVGGLRVKPAGRNGAARGADQGMGRPSDEADFF